jgi:hypothetical protein
MPTIKNCAKSARNDIRPGESVVMTAEEFAAFKSNRVCAAWIELGEIEVIEGGAVRSGFVKEAAPESVVSGDSAEDEAKQATQPEPDKPARKRAGRKAKGKASK